MGTAREGGSRGLGKHTYNPYRPIIASVIPIMNLPLSSPDPPSNHGIGGIARRETHILNLLKP